MKTFPIAPVVAIFVSASSLLGADLPQQGCTGHTIPSIPPKGLSDSDWSGIRGAYEKHRHAIVANPDGSHQARNPGQAWMTKFDGRGFTVTHESL